MHRELVDLENAFRMCLDIHVTILNAGPKQVITLSKYSVFQEYYGLKSLKFKNYARPKLHLTVMKPAFKKDWATSPNGCGSHA